MKRRDLLIRAGLLAAGVGGAFWFRDHVLWRRPEVAFSHGETTGWLDYARPDAITPTVRVHVGGREVTALVDSGAQYSVIDQKLIDELGTTSRFDIPLVAYGVGGQPQMGKGASLDVALAGMRMEALRAAILDLGPLAGEEGLAAPLILGQDVLNAVVLDLDPPGRRLRMTRPSAHRLDADLFPVPVRKRRTALIADVTVEGAVLTAVVDTGASALLALSAESAEAAGLLDGRPQTEGSSIVLGGVIPARVVTARTITVGDRLYRRVATPIYADAALPGFPQALLGMGAFIDGRVTLDIGRAGLHLPRRLDLTIGGPSPDGAG